MNRLVEMIRNFFETSTPSQSEEVMKIIALGKGHDLIKAIEDEKKKSSEGQVSEGEWGGIVVRRVGSACAEDDLAMVE